MNKLTRRICFRIVFCFVGVNLVSAAPSTCPQGYSVYRVDSQGVACSSAGSPSATCPGQAYVYTCGPLASQCCSINQNNPCMPGFHACKYDNFGSGAKTCCSNR
jgi:hypothetical protein